MSRRVDVVLGRDGMGELADEADFDAWVAFVVLHIDEETGLDVVLCDRGTRDVQSTVVRAYAGDDEQCVRDALVRLWDSFCETPEAWPSRELAS